LSASDVAGAAAVLIAGASMRRPPRLGQRRRPERQATTCNRSTLLITYLRQRCPSQPAMLPMCTCAAQSADRDMAAVSPRILPDGWGLKGCPETDSKAAARAAKPWSVWDPPPEGRCRSFTVTTLGLPSAATKHVASGFWKKPTTCLYGSLGSPGGRCPSRLWHASWLPPHEPQRHLYVYLRTI